MKNDFCTIRSYETASNRSSKSIGWLTCCMVSKQYSAVHNIEQVLQISASVSFFVSLLRPLCASLSIVWIWKLCMIFEAAPPMPANGDEEASLRAYIRFVWNNKNLIFLPQFSYFGKLLFNTRPAYSFKYFWNVVDNLTSNIGLGNNCMHWVIQFL